MQGRAGYLLRAVVLGASMVVMAARAQEAPTPPTAPAAPTPAVVTVVMHTAIGDIRVALETERAPITASNFLRYADQKRFDGIVFYRAVKLDEEGKYGLVQGGLRNDPKLVLKPIAHEPPASTGLSHLDGAISMAQAKPGTAQADFFFVIGDLPDLDGKGTPESPGYAVFGRVTAGMDVVRAIMALPRSETAGEGAMKGQMLASPVRILTVRRAD